MRIQRKNQGFTVVELLVVIVIVAVLFAISFVTVNSGILKANQAATLELMRDMGTGIETYRVDYNRPPLPEARRTSGTDTIYGGSNGDYGTELLIAALKGFPDDDPDGDTVSADIKEINSRGDTYWDSRELTQPRKGVFKDDGKLYDAWENEIMIAINAPPFAQEENGGVRDKLLFTDGQAEWSDRSPRYQDFIMWSYGKDGEKNESLDSSDDVAKF